MMCRKPRLLATLAAPVLLALCAPALAQAPAQTNQAPNQTAAQAVAASLPADPGPQPASAQARSEAQRLPALARAAFWAREVDVAPRDPVAGASLANALRGLGRIEEAQQAADSVLVAHPNDLEALLEAMRTRLAQNQGFFAIDLGRRAQRVAPTDWRAPSLLAIAYEQSERDAEAVTAHQTAIQLAPFSATPLSNLAMFKAGRSDLPGAEELLRRAVRMPDATVQVKLNLALVLGLQGRLTEAETLTRESLPPEIANNNMAWLREATAKPAAATPGRSYESVRSAGS